MFFLYSTDSNVDPSLAIMQQRLKKAKLTDELNEKIANRPGPLELVEQSILEADDPLKTALKGKHVLFEVMSVPFMVQT